ncbi:MAG: hypothetical protein WCP79_06095 [Bacillota bacterium]
MKRILLMAMTICVFISGSCLAVADPFMLAVARNWSVWSGTANATTDTSLQTRSLIDKLGDPAMAATSNDAAALAAIAFYYSLVAPEKLADGKLNRNPAITLNSIMTTDASNNSQYTETGSKINSVCFQPMVAELNQLAGKGFPLYTSGQPTFANIQQNKIGDCYLMSAIGWLVHNRPAAIPGMIKLSKITTASGTEIPYRYHVNLPGMKNNNRGNVTLTQAEVAFFSKITTVADGMWEPVIQKAVAQTLLDYYQGDDDNEVLYNLELKVTSAANIQKIFTGSRSRGYNHKNSTASGWGEAMNSALGNPNNLRMVQAMTPGHGGSPYLPGDHWYAILAYDAPNMSVTIWNPWGDTNQYRTDGVFTMALQDFYDRYEYLTIQ